MTKSDAAAKPELMNKGDFARLICVTPARISQYIAAGILDAEALDGEGRFARVRVDVAIRQIAERRHAGQSLGNGAKTRLVGPTTAKTPATGMGSYQGVASVSDTLHRIQLAQLEAAQRKNRLAALEEAQRAGKLVPVADMRRALATVVEKVVAIYDQAAPDLGNELAARLGVPSRDVVHAVRDILNRKRALAAAKLRADAEGLPEFIEGTL